MTEDGSRSFAALYEELRHHMLEGSNSVNQLGLVLLLRDGVTAWMRNVATPGIGAQKRTSSDRTAPSLPDEINKSIVQMLANLALSETKEIRT